jgi:hypothetical protein
MEEGQILIKFIKKNRGQLVGVVVASGPKQIGWSVCNKADRPGGRFNKQKAIEIALGRSLKIKNPQKMVDEVAISARKEYLRMINRAKNFKGF